MGLRLAFVGLLLGLLWPLRQFLRRNILKSSGWVELRLAGDLLEIPPKLSFQELLTKQMLGKADQPKVVLTELRTLVDELIEDKHAQGILIRLGTINGGWAMANAVRLQLMRCRQAQKKVVIHIERTAGNIEMLIASAADHLLAPPNAWLMAGGASLGGLFFKDLFSRLGIKIEVASVGKYKSAPDALTRSSRSEADLEQTKAIVDALDQTLSEALTAGRKLDPDNLKSILDKGLMVGRTAAEVGLIDAVAHNEDLREELKKFEQIDRKSAPVESQRYIKTRQGPSRLFPRKQARVGVVRIHGAIVDEAPSQGAGSIQDLAVEKQVVADLRSALNNPKIASVVVLIESRGGSVTASDAIWAAIKRLDVEKPVVACFSNVAASGGYYVACGARNIVCSPQTLTGSIGVFSIIPTWPELVQRLSIGQDMIKNYENAELFNPWAGLSESFKIQLQTQTEVVYRDFIDHVANSRGKTQNEAEEVAQGRVWVGKDALRVGLVDGLGGFEEAFDRAKSLAQVEVDNTPLIIHAKRPPERPAPISTEGAISPTEIIGHLTEAAIQSKAAKQVFLEAYHLWQTTHKVAPKSWLWTPLSPDLDN